MGYTDRLKELRLKGDPQEVLDFLKGIFKAEGNQTIEGMPAEEFYDDDDGDRLPIPADIIDLIVEGFQPQKSFTERVELVKEYMSVAEFDELAMFFKPFNAFKFHIEDYERCEVIIDSGHYDSERGIFERFYGLNHTIIFDEDSTEDYDIVYELKDDDNYKISYEGEVIKGKILYYDLKVTLYSLYIQDLVNTFLDCQWFATKAKGLPFYFLMESADYRDDSWLFIHSSFSEDDLNDFSQKENLIKSSAPPAEPTDEQRYWFLYSYRFKPESPEFKELIDHCAANDQSFDRLLKTSYEALDMGQNGLLDALSPLLWKLMDSRKEPVLIFQKKIFQRSLENLIPEDKDKGPNWLERALSDADSHISMLQSTLEAAPEEYVETIRPTYDKALSQLAAHESPIVRLVSAEAQCGGIPEDPSEEYIDDLISYLKLFPEEHSGYGHRWDFVMDRLKELGQKAQKAIPPIVEMMDRYCGDRVDEQLISLFAKVLYSLGLEEVPELVHKCNARNQFMIPYYKEWCKIVPTRQLTEFSEAREKSAQTFEKPEPWEFYLHDSSMGFTLFAELIEQSDDLIESLFKAASTVPGPKLSDLLTTLADRAKKKKDYSEMVAFLSPVKELDEAHQEDLMNGRLALLYLGIQAEETELQGEFDLLFDLYPSNPVLIYLDCDNLLRKGETKAAVERYMGHAPTLCKDDLVYRKAFWKYTRDGDESFECEPGYAYALLQATKVSFEKDNLTAGVFDGLGARFTKDPFYRMFSGVFGSLSDEKLAERLDGSCKEYEFLINDAELSEEQLIEHLNSDAFSIAMVVAKTLVKRENPDHSTALLALLDRVAHDEDKIEELSYLLYASPIHRQALMGNESFHKTLSTFVKYYPLNSRDLIYKVVDLLEEVGREDVACQLAFDLEPLYLRTTFKAFLDLFIKVKEFDKAIELLEKVLKAIKRKKPEYTLVISNLAVMHIHADQYDEAEALFDKLFAMDFSRFEKKKSEFDLDMTQIIGGSIDDPAMAHHQYFRMARFNQACLFAKTDRQDKAMESLHEAVAMGHYTKEKILAESDLKDLRERDDFQKLLASLKETK